MNTTYANIGYNARVSGNHDINVKYKKGDNTYLTTVPSLIFNPDTTNPNSNILNLTGTYLVVNKGPNLRYNVNINSIQNNKNGDEIMQIVKNNPDAKLLTVDITPIITATTPNQREQEIKNIFGTGGTNEIPGLGMTSKQALASIGAISSNNEETIDTTVLTQTIDNIITGGTSSTITTQQKASCDGVSDGGTKDFWSITSTPFTGGNDQATCDAAKKTFTCDNGIWKNGTNLADTTTYQYTTECIVGTPNNCTANGSYNYNTTGHIYNIGEIIHGNTTTVTSSNVLENNGTFTYDLTLTCNNGAYTSESESTATLVSCANNYTWNGNTCVANNLSYISHTCQNGTEAVAMSRKSGLNYWLCLSDSSHTLGGNIITSCNSNLLDQNWDFDFWIGNDNITKFASVRFKVGATSAEYNKGGGYKWFTTTCSNKSCTDFSISAPTGGGYYNNFKGITYCNIANNESLIDLTGYKGVFTYHGSGPYAWNPGYYHMGKNGEFNAKIRNIGSSYGWNYEKLYHGLIIDKDDINNNGNYFDLNVTGIGNNINTWYETGRGSSWLEY